MGRWFLLRRGRAAEVGGMGRGLGARGGGRGRRGSRTCLARPPTFFLFLRVTVALIFDEAGAGRASGAGHALQAPLHQLAQLEARPRRHPGTVLALCAAHAQTHTMRSNPTFILGFSKQSSQDSPCRRQSPLFCHAGSWTGCRTCRIPQSSLTGLSQQTQTLKNAHIYKSLYECRKKASELWLTQKTLAYFLYIYLGLNG